MSSAHLLEKGELLPTAAPEASAKGASAPANANVKGIKKTGSSRWFKRVFWTYMAARVAWEGYHSYSYYFDTFDGAPACPQAVALAPQKNAQLWDAVNRRIGSPAFKGSAVQWLSGAVQVPTESFDNMDPVGEDNRWLAFGPFHEYLLNAFPLVHKNLKLTKVNTYGLHYEWTGSDSSLKPILLAAHQDVVPVDPTTVDEWEHPPYSGHFDGERVWGRGSIDDKSGLIGIMSTIETLIQANFQPARTVVLSFGFDEETSGFNGAGHLATHLKETYGEDSFAMIVDEGSGFQEQYGSVVATPGIAEKGFLNVLVEVTAPGGHSSLPPSHTSIGMLSALLVKYENNPYKTKLTRGEPIYATLQCVAEHGKDVPKDLRRTVKQSTHNDRALHHLQQIIRDDYILNSLVGTTQAIDMIQGGVKSNALPERAWAIVNHRISVVSLKVCARGSLDEVKAHDTKLLKDLAKEFNLNYTAFGSELTAEGTPAKGTLTLSDAYNGGLEPAPVSPSGSDAAPYQLLSGTIKATYNKHRGIKPDVDSIIVAPSMMSGNTDTRFYWDLSPHIFRYNHLGADTSNPLAGVHTVNESNDINSFLEVIRFFTTLILNADEANL